MQTYYPNILRESQVVGYWRLNDSDGSVITTDFAARFDLLGTYASTQARGPSLIQIDASAASARFGGVNASMAVSDVAQLRIIGDLTLEAWIVPYSQSQTCLLAGKLNVAKTIANPYSLRLVSGQLQIALGNGTTQTVLSGGTPPPSIPSHVAVTSFRGALTTYLNGQSVAVGTLGSQAVSDGGQSFFAGAAGTVSPFNGLMAELALYNGALSTRRVARHFVIGQQIFSDPAHYLAVDPPTLS